MVERSPQAATGVEASSTLTCPKCGHAQDLAMPMDSCLFFHKCAGCSALLSPKPGDCCVFCSYGSAKCPPKQAEGGAYCGGSGATTLAPPALNQSRLFLSVHIRSSS